VDAEEEKRKKQYGPKRQKHSKATCDQKSQKAQWKERKKKGISRERLKS